MTHALRFIGVVEGESLADVDERLAVPTCCWGVREPFE